MNQLIKNIHINYDKFKNFLTKSFKNQKKEYAYLTKPFFILTIIYLLAVYPIIRANFNYIDDLSRVQFGLRGWKNFSRFISEYLSIFIHSNKYLTDISPLTQIIAIFFLVISSIIILHLFKNNKKITFLNLVTVIPLGLSPYFLECISYKYDSPYMALSILASTFPFLFYNKNSKYNLGFLLMTFLGTIIMCTSYQAASGIIPLITIFLAFKAWNKKEGKDALKIVVSTSIGYLLGLIIFKLFIMIPTDTYASNSLLPIKELVPGFLKNLKIYYKLVISDFKELRLILIVFISICFVIVQSKQSKQNKVFAATISIILLTIAGFSAFGLYPALSKPIFPPRAMYGFGVLIALIGVNATNDKKLCIPKFISLCLCWCLFTFPFTYGNALSEQKRYIDFRVQSVIVDLNKLEIMKTNTLKTVRIKGNIGHAPSIENMPAEYKNILTRLVCQSFSGDWYWDTKYFLDYFKLPNISINNDSSLTPNNLTLAEDTVYHKIETNKKDYILITLK